MLTETELKLAEIVGYLQSVEDTPTNFGLLCNFFKDLPYNANGEPCLNCIMNIDGECFLHSLQTNSNRILDKMKEKNKFKLDDDYKNGMLLYE